MFCIRVSGIAVVLLTLVLRVGMSAQTVTLAGTYRCEGTNPDGTTYRSVVEIVEDGDTYVVRWAGPRGDAIGIGIVKDNALSVSYSTGRGLGIVVYQIEKGPTLTGQWSILGADGQLYPEKLTRAGRQARDRGTEPSVAAVAGRAARDGQ